MELKEPIATKLRKLRVKKNMSQSDVAKHLHLTRQAISAWENGKSEPDKEILMQLCDFYGTSMDELYEVKKESGISTEINHVSNEDLQKTSNQNLLSSLEQICLSTLAAIFCMFPYVGVIAPIGIMIWMLVKKKRYIIVYIVCIAALFVGINNTIVVTGQLLDFGQPTIEIIE